MDVLCFDNDARWMDLARGVLSASGHRVVPAADLATLSQLAAQPAIGAVLVNLDLPGDTVPQLATALASRAGGAPLVLGATRRPARDPSVVRQLEPLPGAVVIRHPVSLIDLSDLLGHRRPAPPAPVAAPATAAASRPFAAAPSRPGAGVGDARGGPARRGAPFGDGVDALASLVALGATHEAPVRRSPAPRSNDSIIPAGEGRFDAANVEGLLRVWRGQRSAELRLRGTAQGRGVLLRRGGLVDPRDRDQLVRMLRQGDLSAVDVVVEDGPSDRAAVGALLFEALSDPANVAFAQRHLADRLSVLDWETVAVLRLPGGLRSLLSGQGEKLGVLCGRYALAADEISVGLCALVRLGAVALSPPAPAAGAPEAAGVALGPPTVSSVRRARSEAGSGLDETSTITTLGGRAGARGVRVDGVDVGSVEQVHRRLERELDRLRGAPSSVVLGLPADADAAAIEQMSERMLRRYAGLAQAPELPPETTALATALVGLVRDAARGASVRQAGNDDPAGDRALLRARSLLERGEFTQADRMLSAAQERTPTDPSVLAPLGWARANNAGRPPGQRLQDGLELLLLAEQLDPNSIDAARWICKLLIQKNDYRGALLRATRGLRRAPTDAELRGLVSDLERRLAAAH